MNVTFRATLVLLAFMCRSVAEGAGGVTSNDVLASTEARFCEKLATFDSLLTRDISLEDDLAAGVFAMGDPAEATQMEPFVITIDKLPQFRERAEDRVQRFFRTGTLAQHVGRKVTSRLWMRGDKGVMMSFSW